MIVLSGGMTATPDQQLSARFDWTDALPDSADNLDVLLAKYARLRFVYEVSLQCDQHLVSRRWREAAIAVDPENHIIPAIDRRHEDNDTTEACSV